MHVQCEIVWQWKEAEELIQWGWTLKSLCWNERSQIQKVTYCMIPLSMAHVQSRQIYRDPESRWDRKWWGDSESGCSQFQRTSSRGNGNALKLNNGDGYYSLVYILKKKNHLTVYFSNDSFYVTWIISQFLKNPRWPGFHLVFILAPCWVRGAFKGECFNVKKHFILEMDLISLSYPSSNPVRFLLTANLWVYTVKSKPKTKNMVTLR